MARARLRTRVRRSAYVLLALVLLLLLLELNQWLPGTWPGGGGGGFREAGEAGEADPSKSAALDAPPADRPEDAGTLEPPSAPPGEWPPREGVTVEARGADGSLAEGWRFGTGEGGAEGARPFDDGTLRARDKRVVREGFRVRSAAGVLRHRQGVDRPAARWSVHLPQGELPVRRAPMAVEVQVTHAGQPLPGAEVSWAKGGEPQQGRTDAQGRLKIPGTRDGVPIEVTVTAPGHLPQTVLLEQHDPSEGRIELDTLRDVDVRYAPSEASVIQARLRASDGSVLAKGEVSVRGPQGQRATFRLPGRRLADAWIETVVGTPQGPFVFRRPLDEARQGLRIPESRRVDLRLRDKQGRRMDAPAPQVEFATYEGARAEDEPRGTRLEHMRIRGPGGLDISPVHDSGFMLAAGAHARVLLEPEGAVPIVRTLTPLDGHDMLEFVVEPGLAVPVQVLREDGTPLIGAEVTVRAAVEGMRVLRRAACDAQGRAQPGPLGAWSVEVFATAPGHAPSAQVVDVRAAMGTVTLRLARGHPLHLVVADPYGRPLQGVNVEVTARGDTPPPVLPPGEPPHVTGPDGVLTLHGVRAGTYDVALTHEGYGAQTLRGVQPGAITHFATLIER